MSLQIHPALRALGVGIGGLALLVGGSLAAYTGLRSLVQAGAPAQNYIANPDAGRERIPLLVKQSQGDWSRLSSQDRQMLDSMTAGHGREMLRSLARKRDISQTHRRE